MERQVGSEDDVQVEPKALSAAVADVVDAPGDTAVEDLSGSESDTSASASVAKTDSIADINAVMSAPVSAVPAPNQRPTAKRTSDRMSKLQSGPLEFSSHQNDKPVLIMVFTCVLITGVIISQLAAANLDYDAHHNYVDGVAIVTMNLLSFIMIGVGCEFDIDKSNLGQYVKDYGIGMTAAGLPWLWVGAWFIWVLPLSADTGMWWGEALFCARFAAPTSAGILFTMLTAAGLTETWLFQKARILAIFDDLDTILFMLPLKVIIGGFHWEIAVDLTLLGIPLVFAWFYLHKIKAPSTWPYKVVYAVIITTFCRGLYIVTKYYMDMEAIHLEVLLPAFVVGCCVVHEHETPTEKRVATGVSAFFMFFVGLSTPPLTLDGPGSVLSVSMAGHIAAVTILMIAGKMFPVFCYKDEADWLTRLALCLGMCPRGEVGAGLIVIAIESGIKGPAIELAVVCLVINLVLSGAFVTWTKQLARTSEARVEKARVAYLSRKAARAKAKRDGKLIKNAAATFFQVLGQQSDEAVLKIHFVAWTEAVTKIKAKRERKEQKEKDGKGKDGKEKKDSKDHKKDSKDHTLGAKANSKEVTNGQQAATAEPQVPRTEKVSDVSHFV
jgi:Kef-type K+ transport system membrane component KefB